MGEKEYFELFESEMDDAREADDPIDVENIDFESFDEKFEAMEEKISGGEDDDFKLTDKEKDEFVRNNEALVHFVAKKFQNTRIEHSELVDIANLGLTKALNGYRKNRGVKFSTYAHNCMYNEILFYLRKEKKHHENTVSFNNPVATDKDGHVFEEESRISETQMGTYKRSLEEDAEVHEAVDCLNKIIEGLNETERFIIVSRFGLGGTEILTQKEIADKINMSQANISKLEKTIMTKISKLMTTQYGFDNLSI